jgi:hypothetical protein
MDSKLCFGILSATVSVLQYPAYIRDVIKGKTKPHAFSWFVWGLPCGIVFAAQIMKGGGAGAWATGLTTVFCTAIFLLSLRYGEKEITVLDKTCLALALLAIVLWIMTKDPLGSVALITVADVLGFLPTLRKSMTKPHEETATSYLIGSLKWLLSLFALGSFTLTTALYPATMTITNTALVGMLIYRRRMAE